MILKARAPHGGTAGEPMRIEKYGNSIGNIQDSEGWARSDGPDHDVDTLKCIVVYCSVLKCSVVYCSVV